MSGKSGAGGDQHPKVLVTDWLMFESYIADLHLSSTVTSQLRKKLKKFEKEEEGLTWNKFLRAYREVVKTGTKKGVVFATGTRRAGVSGVVEVEDWGVMEKGNLALLYHRMTGSTKPLTPIEEAYPSPTSTVSSAYSPSSTVKDGEGDGRSPHGTHKQRHGKGKGGEGGQHPHPHPHPHHYHHHQDEEAAAAQEEGETGEQQAEATMMMMTKGGGFRKYLGPLSLSTLPSMSTIFWRLLSLSLLAGVVWTFVK